jgi:hypothetical protein
MTQVIPLEDTIVVLRQLHPFQLTHVRPFCFTINMNTFLF